MDNPMKNHNGHALLAMGWLVTAEFMLSYLKNQKLEFCFNGAIDGLNNASEKMKEFKAVVLKAGKGSSEEKDLQKLEEKYKTLIYRLYDVE